MADARFGVVTAAAGWGKTALLAQWATDSALSTIWCGSSARGSGSTLLRRLAHGVSVTAGSEPQSYDELIRATYDYTSPVVLVVDDLDPTGGTPAALERFLLDCSPQVRLLVASRRRLRFNLARSELPSAVLLTGEDLRFRTYEIEELFRRTYGQPLTPAGVQNLAARTDGWAACLHLFHLSFAGRRGVDQKRAAECLGDRLGFAADYLEHQVLGGLPERLRDLLQSTSPFDVLTPGLCDAVHRTHSSRALLQQLDDAGLLEREGDDEAYRLPRALRQHLRSSLINDASHADWPEHCAAAAEGSGHVGQALRIRAETGDWNALLQTLRRTGSDAIQQGRCGWSALAPREVRAEPLVRLAEAQRLLDDGALAASAAMAASVLAHADDAGSWREAAARILARSTAWADAAPNASSDAFVALCAATHAAPGGVASLLDGTAQPDAMLAAGLASLLSGDQRAALPVLRRCTGAMEESPFVALAAQVALVVVAADQSSGVEPQVTDELDSVRRAAENRGYTWLARLAASLAIGNGATSRRQRERAAALCDEQGDFWGAALVLAAGAIRDLMNGRPDAAFLDALSDRFRALRAPVPEAWSRAAHALAAADADEPDAIETAQTAVSFARLAGAPGALALAYAAWGMCDRERRGELMILAGDTARQGGLLCKPWTRLGRDAPAATPVLSVAKARRPRAEPAIEVRCFGGFSVRTDGVEVDLSRIRPQARTVLRILAIHRGQPVHRDVLIDALWGNLGARAAMHMLQVSVSALRHLMSFGGEDAPSLVGRDGEAYALATASGTTVDLVDFDTALHDAALARSRGETAGELAALRRTTQLYLGDLLPEDGSSEWIVDTREGYRLRAGEAASSLARLELELGNRAAAEAAAVRSIEIDPYRDESWRVLIGMFEHAGDVVAARRAQQRYQTVLATLGVT